MEIIIAIIGTVTTIVTAILTNYFTKKNQLKFNERQLKEKYYLEYIEAISRNINNIAKDDGETINENHAFNRLILIGNEDMINKLYRFQDLRIRQLKYNDVSEYDEKYTTALNDLIKAMRKDLYGKEDKEMHDIYFLGGVLKENYTEERQEILKDVTIEDFEKFVKENKGDYTKERREKLKDLKEEDLEAFLSEELN